MLVRQFKNSPLTFIKKCMKITNKLQTKVLTKKVSPTEPINIKISTMLFYLSGAWLIPAGNLMFRVNSRNTKQGVKFVQS